MSINKLKNAHFSNDITNLQGTYDKVSILNEGKTELKGDTTINKLAINKNIGSYQLDVNGSINSASYNRNGVSLDTIYQPIGNYLQNNNYSLITSITSGTTIQWSQANKIITSVFELTLPNILSSGAEVGKWFKFVFGISSTSQSSISTSNMDTQKIFYKGIFLPRIDLYKIGGDIIEITCVSITESSTIPCWIITQYNSLSNALITRNNTDLFFGEKYILNFGSSFITQYGISGSGFMHPFELSFSQENVNEIGKKIQIFFITTDSATITIKTPDVEILEGVSYQNTILYKGNIITTLTMTNLDFLEFTLIAVPQNGLAWCITNENRDYLLNSTFNSSIANYYNKSYIDNLIANYLTTSSFNTSIENYYNKSSIDTILANYLTTSPLVLRPYNRNELSNVKYVIASTSLSWGDPENIIFFGNGNWTITLPSVTFGGASRVGSRFTFGFRFPYTGTKTIAIQSLEYIYDGGTTEASRKIQSIGMTRETLHTITLLCIAVDLGSPVWEVVTRHFSPATPFTWSAQQTFADITSTFISLTGKNSILNNKYLTTASTTLVLGDPEHFFFGLNADQTVTLPSIVGASTILGTRFTFALTANQSGTKTIQAQTNQFIYDGGTVNNRSSITLSRTTDYFYTIVCVNQVLGQPCWAVVSRAINPLFSYTFSGSQTFTGGITASGTQTINFGGNAPTMSGANIQGTSIPNSALQTSVLLTTGTQLITGEKSFSVPPSMEGTNIAGVVKTTGDENINGIKIFISPPVMSGASITATSIPNSALQTSVVLTDNTQTISGSKTFSVAPTMSGANITLASIPSNSLINVNIDTINENTSFGESTGSFLGGANCSFGKNAMQQGALMTGSQNSAFGTNSLQILESGSLNCAYGANSLTSLSSGSSNSCFGNDSGSFLTTQSNNTLIGKDCGYANQFSNCTGLGKGCVFTNGVNYGTAIGVGVVCNTSNTVKLGRPEDTVKIDGALTVPTPISTSNSTNVATTAFVYGKIRVDDTLNNQSCGLNAGLNLTTGSENLAFGSLANRDMTTGYRNVAIGYGANQNHNGFQNVAIGYNAMSSTWGQIPTNNVAIGAGALTGCLTGCDGNFALGSNSLSSLTIGTNNVMVGYYSGGALTTGNYNNGVGYGALNTITTGDRNCGIGIGCGGGIITGSKNTFLGDSTSSSGDFSNSTAIGADSQITASNQIVIGTTNESIFVRGCTYLKSCAPIQTDSFTISSTLIYENYPINITSAKTVTLPTASAELVGITIRFRRIAGNAVTLNSASSNIRPGTSTTTSNATILTASNTTSAGNSNLLICLPLTASTYSWHTAT